MSASFENGMQAGFIYQFDQCLVSWRLQVYDEYLKCKNLDIALDFRETRIDTK